ncbi:hypothetical protein GCM10008106_33240 [Mongoliitalea lutea]|uniref:Polysaccharide chain length determinant N-terminal domain-containing protein n=2 Tax=Mongoliitalea lutea TaxID=849756 RepID=A0A8J3CZK5_9BACT|nr:hypothetical protein GCM10008106_33240 [Mongoliitalea lutea]
MIINTGIASGFNLSSMNNTRVDYFAVNNAFDNLTTIIQSRETLEELAINLLASHLCDGDEYKPYISQAIKTELNGDHLEESLFKELSAIGNREKIKKRLYEIYQDTSFNDVKRIIQKTPSFYNIDEIRNNLSLNRKASSDMLEVIYKATDPGVCFQTLDMLSEIFINKYLSSRNFEAGGIIEYFMAELERAKERLNIAEENLKNYSQKNQIINYEEQTKFIAEAKEELERDIYKVNMEIQGAEAALLEVNKKLDNQTRRFLNSSEILETRNRLSKLNTEITSLSLRKEKNFTDKLDSINQLQVELRNKIKTDSEQFYHSNYSTEVIPRITILNEYLRHTLDIDMGKARVTVLEKHRNYFNKLFNEFAPIGFNLSKMAREIQIAEQEYLSILHGLNQAKIHKSNSELFGNLQLLDNPFFPINPKSSKTLLLVVGGAIVSMFFVVGVIIGKDFFDRTLRSPTVIEKNTGLKLIGAFPHAIKNKNIDQEQLLFKLKNLTINNLAIELKDKENPPLIFLMGTRAQDNLTKSGLFLAESLSTAYQKIVYFYYLDNKNDLQESSLNTSEKNNIVVKKYEANDPSIFEKIIKYKEKNYSQIIQVPEFENANLYHLAKLNPSTIILLISADQGWGFHDNSTLQLIRKIFGGTSISVFATQMDPEFMEEIISEIPKKRSKTRVWLKSLITQK